MPGVDPGGSFDPTGDGFIGDGGPGPRSPGGGPAASRAGGLTLEDTVESVVADSITIRTEGGGTVTIGLDADTTYHQQAAASPADVASGGTVLVRLTPGVGRGAAPDAGSGTPSMGTASDVMVVP